MGKKRIITEAGHVVEATAPKAGGKKKLSHGIIAIESTYNNTKMVLSDGSGNVVFWTSSGSLGFKGAKKGTPFAASKVAEIICDQAMGMGVKEINVVVKGVGAGRKPDECPNNKVDPLFWRKTRNSKNNWVRAYTTAPISVLPIYTDISKFHHKHHTPDEYTKHPIILTVSRLAPEKRIDLVIRALVRLPTSTNALNHHIDLFNAHTHGLIANNLGYFTGRKWRTLFSTLKAEGAARGPKDDIARAITQHHLSVVISRLNGNNTVGQLFLATSLRRSCLHHMTSLSNNAFLSHIL
jgi:ribosomal protein S11